MQNYNPPHPPNSTALPYDDDDDEDVLQIFCNQFNHHHRPSPLPPECTGCIKILPPVHDGDDANGIGDDGDGGDDEDDDDNSNSGDGGGGIIVERVMKRGSGEATHYSSLYNEDLLENSGYLMHQQQQKYRTMTNASVIPPALPMRNAPSYDSSSSHPNNTSGNGNNSASTLNKHYSHDYKTDQNINTNFKNLSNTHNLDSSCTANRRKNY